MFRVQTLNAISTNGLDRLPADKYEVGNDVTDPDAYLVRSAKLHNVEIPLSVLAIARAGAGTNNIPVDAMSKRGVVVFNTPGANANAVKELVLAGLLMTARNLFAAADYVRALEVDPSEMDATVEAAKKQFVGWELPDRTLGVIGLGAIGVQVANAAAALGMHVLGYDPQITVRHAWQLSAQVERAASLEDVFRRADVITTHVPLIDATKGLVNADRLALMSPNAVVLNFARAGIVDEQAILDALNSGALRGYVCDFPSPELNRHPKVIALPHLGASTYEAEDNCAVMAADELRAYLERGEITNSVNFPDAGLPRGENTTRICVVNNNVPNMVGQISTVLANAGLNIADLLNKSRGDLAYTLIDVEGRVPEAAADQISGIEGVLSVRVI